MIVFDDLLAPCEVSDLNFDYPRCLNNRSIFCCHPSLQPKNKNDPFLPSVKMIWADSDGWLEVWKWENKYYSAIWYCDSWRTDMLNVQWKRTSGTAVHDGFICTLHLWNQWNKKENLTVRIINNTIALFSKHAFFLAWHEKWAIELLTYISCKTIVLWFCWTVTGLHWTSEAPLNHAT